LRSAPLSETTRRQCGDDCRADRNSSRRQSRRFVPENLSKNLDIKFKGPIIAVTFA
jgi:hypothetical protein